MNTSFKKWSRSQNATFGWQQATFFLFLLIFFTIFSFNQGARFSRQKQFDSFELPNACTYGVIEHFSQILNKVFAWLLTLKGKLLAFFFPANGFHRTIGAIEFRSLNIWTFSLTNEIHRVTLRETDDEALKYLSIDLSAKTFYLQDKSL